MRHVFAILLGLLLLAAALPNEAAAKPLVADIAVHRIDITSGFTGTEVLLYGARNDPGDVVVVVRGPEKDYIIRRKERFGGIWVNRQTAELHSVPHYYYIASSRPLEELGNPQLFKALEIGPSAISYAPTPQKQAENASFMEAFRDAQKRLYLYGQQEEQLTFLGETLFKAIIPFPEKTPRGRYTAEVYLIQHGQLMGMQVVPFSVTKSGFDAFVYDAAHQHPMLYGLVAVLIALVAGWGAGTLLRKI